MLTKREGEQMAEIERLTTENKQQALRIAELEGAILTIYRGYHSQGFMLLEDTVEKVMKPALAEGEK